MAIHAAQLPVLRSANISPAAAASASAVRPVT